MKDSRVHDEFKEQIQEARALYIRQKYDAPELDMDKLKSVYKTSRKKTIKRMIGMAAMLTIILICGMSMGVWISGDGAYGGQQFIEKCLTVIEPEEEKSEIQPGVDYEKVIENEDEVDAALDELDVAHKPGYIPSDCEFDNVTIVYDSDAYGTAENPSPWAQVTYYYNRGDNVFFVGFDYYQYEGVDVTVVGKLYKSPVTGQEMYIAEYEDTGEFSVIACHETYDCCVMGLGDVEEGIKTMESIYQYK